MSNSQSEPPSKAAKLGEASGECTQPTKKWNITCVVESRLKRSTIDTINYHVAVLSDKKQINTILKRLSSAVPLPDELSHIKRVNANKDRIRIVICSATESLEEVKEILRGYSIEEIIQCPIPSETPRNRSQFELAKSIWPTSFREDKELEAKLAGTMFSDEESKRICSLFEELESISKNLGNAAILQDSRGILRGRVSASPAKRKRFPLQHTIMRLVEELACQQNNVNISRSLTTPMGESSKAGYLCSGMDCYIWQEPCAMCAMALLHSRIARVFYSVPTDSGALGSAISLHTDRNLNHRFEVYRVVKPV